ncbi:MAG TPA: hypothetical protein PLZ57_07210 [Pseudobdellovibrionaceae bacterium]|nr:hypothetical protein [Pseudobdellovibrionaceae bacterium]
MTTETQSEPKQIKKPATRRQTFLKKIDAETARHLSQLKERANKKLFGRKVRDAELIALGLKLVEQRHLAELQERTYSEKDRLAIAHDDYQKANGKITLDQFIGRLIRGEVQIQKND